MNTMLKWLQKRRDRRNREIAKAVHAELAGRQGWERFLPPVVLRDRLYLVTESGTIYALQHDDLSGMEQIITIRSTM